jgi:hypothetical protein
MSSKNKLPLLFKLSLIFFLITSFSAFGQNKTKQDDLISSYKEYTQLPRETAYVHLNKTTCLKGEILGYAAYIFDKNSKKPSTTATNVYCTISDKNNKVIKSEMVLAKNGVASGSFQIDSLFTSGQYTFKAYTNWMRNFQEQNYFEQTVKIIDPGTEDTKTAKTISAKLDAQFLPEGGHFVANTKNSVGVIVKDSLGFGIPNITGKVMDSENNTLTDFETNRYGIGKFTYTPKENGNYKVVLKFKDTKQIFPLENPENKGIALTLNDLKNRVVLSFHTNEATLKRIKKQDYTLAIHNGSVLKTINVNFGKSLVVLKTINHEDLSPGINIFTLFDENNNPILERLFFKYDGINLLTAEKPKTIGTKDSLTIQIPIKNIDLATANNFSVSVLPNETKSYNPTNNIISGTFLQPYIKSYVENAAYYFTNVTRKKKFELDNVLLTQGWSSYNWNTIFNNPPKPLYEYENGVSFRANANGKPASEYMMYGTINNKMQLFDVDQGDTDFGAIGLYPMNAEKIRFSSVKKNNHIERPNLYLQFSPSKVPDIKSAENTAPLPEDNILYTNKNNAVLQTSWGRAEKLAEVIVKTDKVLSREDKLTRNAFGHAYVMDDLIRKSYLYLSDYIRTKGFKVYEKMGQLTIINPRPVSFGQDTKIKLDNKGHFAMNTKPVLVYFNNIKLINTDMLYKYTMDDVDYIFIDKSGTSEGGAGAAGVIKIFTDPSIPQSKMKRNVSQEIGVPLTFAAPKKFYTPAYSSYNSRFYKNYGVIGWFPTLKVNDSGTLEFTIPKPLIDKLNIFLEGTTNDGSFISGEKTVTIP